MNEFRTYHPIVNFTYFVSVIGFSMFLMHPVSLAISVLCAFLYVFVLKGTKKALSSIFMIIPLMIVAAVINPVFNHQGITILGYLPGGNPLTAESIYYGVAAAAMLAAVILHFSCYNSIMTSDKFVYLFGKIIPTLSLVLSMTLGFIPKLAARLKKIKEAQKTLGRDISQGNIFKRMRCAIKILSILITWSLESGVETADSMKNRGYGLPGRTAYSIFSFDKRDLKAFLWILCLSLFIIGSVASETIYYSYFPVFILENITFLSVLTHMAYFFLCLTPVIIEVREAYRWKATE